MNSRKPVLVTCPPRAGSTWVARIISASPSVGYIREPFSRNQHPGICAARFEHWFPYITDDNECFYYQHIKNTLCFRYNVTGHLKAIRSLKDVGCFLKNYPEFLAYRLRGVRAFVKGADSVFMAEWLARTFDMDVVILIRHPAAFASSWKRLNWTHEFSHFLRQPLLMRDYLYPFEEQIKEYARKEHDHDIVNQAILLWNIIYSAVRKYQESHKDWVFLRHEDISRDPLGQFRDLFQRLDLDFSARVRRVIQESSSPSNPVEAPPGRSTQKHIKRDSKANIWNWKKRLTETEIERIREQVEDIAKAFYSETDW